jgi:protein involved in polysaccharide export with SLBB domain
MKFDRIILVVISLAIFFLSIPQKALSQSLASADLSTIRVEDLSDEQILSYIQQAENSGYTEAQVEALARQRGMPTSEIMKLRRRVEALRNRSGTVSQEMATETSGGLRNENELFEEDVFGRLVAPRDENQLSEKQQKIFGYALFQSDVLNFSPNLNIPTPKDYILGPGDEIMIDLWGATQASATYTVSPEGTIRPENLRPIYVNGMTIEEFEDMVDDRLSAIYSGLKGDNPTIFYQVTLGQVRTINVSIVGEVNNPGNYALNSLSTVYTALYAAGGPSENGTFRNVQLVRDNKLIQEIDLYSFLSTGIKEDDMRLSNGDIILVKPYLNRVEVEGEVRRPGYYEMKSDESIEDLLGYVGGFSDMAYRGVLTVSRNGEQEKELLSIFANDFGGFNFKDGDYLHVKPIAERYKNRVQIEGAIIREGEYQFIDGMTLKGLIMEAKGLRGDVFDNRATIYRTNPDFTQSVLSVDLAGIMSGAKEDVLLQNEDLVRINSIFDLQDEFTVRIAGEIAEDGIYPFFNQMTVEDLIVLAGGFTQGASGAQIEISRRNTGEDVNNIAEIFTMNIEKDLRLSESDGLMLLEPFDQVYIRKTPGYTFQQEVTIEGEVGAPGIYTISTKDERVSDLIKRAQGLTPFAFPDGAILVRRTEFAETKTNKELSKAYLLELKEKLMKEDSGLKNLSQEELLKRLELIIEEKEAAGQITGAQVKRELFENVSEQDSLIDVVEIKDKEPVALDLQKILDEPGSKYDFILQEGDVISIPGRLETVRVAGEVSSPLNLRYDKSYSFKDYIDQSGGFLQTAKKGRSYAQYPNGKRKGTKRFLFFKFYPKIEPGTTIFVAKKPEKQGLSTAEWLAIASSLATIALTVNTLSNR